MILRYFTLLLVPFFSLQGMEQQKPISCVIPSITQTILDPKTTIIAFDIDEVLLQGRENGFKRWLGIPENTPFAQALGEIKQKYNLSDAHAIIDKVAQEKPAMKEKAQEFKKVLIAAPQIEGTTQIVHKLRNKGYTVVAASNMTTSTYQSMMENKVLPEEFTKDFFFVATNPLNKKVDGKYYEKPSKEYYQNLITYINEKYPGKFKNIIFTDDKLENAQGAKLVAPIKSIHFQNPEQLLNDLKCLGVSI